MTTQYSYYHKIKKEQKQKTNDKNSNSNVSNNFNNFNSIVDCNNTDNIVVVRNTKPPERTIKSNRIIMKVKELRTWLKVAPPPPLFESDVVVAIVEKKKKDKDNSNIMERFYNIENIENIANESNELELESEYESFDLLGIESKSTASTSPSSTFVNVHNNKGETEEPISLSFDNYDELFGGGDEEIDNDDNNNESRPPTPSNLYEKKNDMDHVTGKNHLDLLYKQAPPIAVVVETEQQDTIVNTTTTTTGNIIDSEDGRRVNVDNGDGDDDEENVVVGSDDSSMHNNTSTSSIFLRDQILTKETLDDMCRGDQYKSTFDNVNKQEQKQVLSPTSSSHSHSPYGKKIATADDDDTSCFSQDSNNAPSIAPSVLVSKMASIFLNNHYHDSTATATATATNPERRRYVDPKELSFLQSSSTASSLTTIGSGNYRGNKASFEINGPPPKKPLMKTTSVSVGIRKFGGIHKRKNLIERRKEQLNVKFEESKSAIFIKKKTWSVCNSTGSYKRKIVVDKQGFINNNTNTTNNN